MSKEKLDKLVSLHVDQKGQFSATLKAPSGRGKESCLYGVDRVEELVVIDNLRALLIGRREVRENNSLVVRRVPHLIGAPELDPTILETPATLIRDGKLIHSGLRAIIVQEKQG